MNLTASSPDQRKRQALIDRNRLIERIGLLGATVIFALALILVYSAKRPNLVADQSSMASMASPASPASMDGKRVLNLNALSRPSDVLPLLDSIDGEADRQAVAKGIFDLVIDNERSLSRVGLLSSVRGLDATDIREIKKRVVVRTASEFWRSQLFSVLALAIPFWIVHLIWWKRQFRGDGLILPAVHILCALGFVMMISIRDPLRDSLSSAVFAQGVAGGCAMMLLISMFNFQRSQVRRLAFVPLLASFILSLLLFVFGTGPGTSDAKVNLFGFQPVEVIKLLLVLFLAGYFAEHWELIRELRQKPPEALGVFSRWMNLPPVQYVAPIAGGVAVALLFFTFQKDLGPGLIVSLLFLVYYGVARRKAAVVVLGLLMIIAGFWFVTTFGISRTVATRVAMWQSPWRNFALSGGDHLAHSLWAFASGGVAGAGLGLGSPELVREVSTDFILAGIGEELGFIGTLCVLGLYGLLLFRALKIMQRSPGDYAFFLCLGMLTITGLQILLIGGGVLGVFPLSGVTTPFLSYGRSSLLANFCIFGAILSVSNHSADDAAATKRFASVRVLGLVMATGLGMLAIAAFNVQVLRADTLVAEPVLAYQADKQHRLTYNPRLLQAAAKIPRGTIYDRNGVPLATNHWREIESHLKQYQAMGVNVDAALSREDSRYYPFGGVMFHLLGDARTETNWRASNTAYIERDYEPHLRGFNDSPRFEKLDTPEGDVIEVERHDYSGLVPLLRYEHRPNHPEVKRILEKNRDLHTSIDARLQLAVAEALRAEILGESKSKGAALVMDPANGDVLASVSYPWPDAAAGVNARAATRKEFNRDSQMDRARYGLYPPGSTFKLITAMAALDKSPALADQKFFCGRLPGGRVGAVVRGFDRPIRDDVNDTHPHGEINLAQGLIVSCNAYYAQLGMKIGSEALHKMASSLGIATASPNTAAELQRLLPQASYGQGEVLATPFRLTRAVSAIANAGNMPVGRWVTDAQNSRDESARRVISAESAAFLAKTMRLAVTSGTGARAQHTSAQIAGKTGTAEIANGVSHSWFIGFAPYDSASRKIAFGIIIENGGYGGRSAATVAGRIVDRAKALKIIK